MKGGRSLASLCAAALAASLISASACRPPPPRNVLFIVVDTLRKDHLGCYGYRRNTSPAIDALAADAVRFERAYATAPWTKPSVASMVTGLYPSAHGANVVLQSLPESVDTLAEILADRGYATGGVVSHIMVSRSRGFAQGYAFYHESEARGHDHISTPQVTRQAIGLLEKFALGDRPFLLFVHYFDPHYNYRRHPEFAFATGGSGRLDGMESISQLREMLDELTDREVGFLRDVYDEEIRFTDAGIGELLARLRELGLYDATLIVFTSDHGEEFKERGWIGHTRTLYEELIAVPLIIRHPPSTRGERSVRTPVSLVSLTPTILDLLGIEAPAIPAVSISGHVLGDEDGEADAVFSEVDFESVSKGAFKRAMVTGRLKLIRDEPTGVVELYDLEVDPHERRDLGSSRPDVVERLLPQLEDWIRLVNARAVRPERETLSEKEAEMLRGLGYLEP